MEQKFKSFIRRSLASCGIFRLTRNYSTHLPRIIMYHGFCGPNEISKRRLSVDIFRSQIKHIKKHYSPFKLCDLLEHRMRNGGYPNRSVVITVDDGYENFYRWALPVLREFEVPATLFVVSGLLDQQDWIWVDKVLYLCEHAENNSIFSREYRVALFQTLNRLTISEREQRLAEFEKEFGIAIPLKAPPEYFLMSWGQLAEIANEDLFEIGSHTRTHPILVNLNAEDTWEEVYKSRLEIEMELKVKVCSFCYPNGMPGDYRQDQIEMLPKAGYSCGMASHFGYIKKYSDVFRMPRINGGIKDLNLFFKYLDGVEYFQSRLHDVFNSIAGS